MSTIDRMKNNGIKKYIVYIINYYNLNNDKNNYTMIKLWLMISHMSFMINEWNVPHHVLNDYYCQWLVHNDFKAMNHFSFLWPEY